MLQTTLEPIFVQHTIGNYGHCLETGGPLFRIITMKLPGAHMAYVVELNHIFADGATYYKVVNLINCAINDKPVPELQWRPAPASVALPDVWTDACCDIMMTGWMPAFMEKCGSYVSVAPQDPQYACPNTGRPR